MRLFIFGILLFLSGVVTTVIATTVVDTNTETRANTIWTAIQSNASKMNVSDVASYYQLVRLNIKTLTEVLAIVDKKINQELASIGLPSDTGIIGELTNTGTIPPKTTTPAPIPAPAPAPTPVPPVTNNSCQVGSVTWSPGSTRCEGTTAMVCENKTWKANPNSTQCGGSAPAPTPAPAPAPAPAPTPAPTPAPAPAPGTNSNVGYLVARKYAAEFCKLKFYNPAFTTINQNITKSVDPNCTTGRCLISKFNWVLGGTIIYEDREEKWEEYSGGAVDNIKCTGDNSTAPVDPANTYVKNKTQKCVESEKSYYWFDSNNQKTDLIKKCSTPPNGGLSCSENAGGCCPEGQVAINGQCVAPADEGQACYATSGCKSGMTCNNGSCKAQAAVKYSWESSISSCVCNGEGDFNGTKSENFTCKGDDGSTAFGSQCGDPKPSKSIACTMPTSCSFYENLSISYPQSSVVEGEGLSSVSAKIQKCIGANCTQMDIPRTDLDWTMDLVLGGQRYPGSNMIYANNKLYGFVWTKIDNLGGANMKTGDISSYDMGDFFSGRRELIVGVKVKDPTKYASRNPLQYETAIDVKNRFDARLTKTQSLFQGYGVSRIFIELLGEDGYNEPGNAGLYYFNGACGVTSSNPAVTPTIEFSDVNNYPLSTSANSLPGSRFRVKGLENAPSGTKIDILCTLNDPKTNTTRTITLSETK